MFCDSYSKWMDAFIMKNTNVKIVIEKLRKIFLIFWLPHQVVRGPPFNSNEFISFCKSNGIHPQSNGSAERAVKTFNNGLRKCTLEMTTKDTGLQLKLDRFLLKYSTTPTTSIWVEPSDMIFQYKHKIVSF